MKPSKSQANRFKSKFLASKSITMALVPVVGIIFIQDLRSICKYYNQDLSPKVLQLDVILHSLPNYDEILNDVSLESFVEFGNDLVRGLIFVGFLGKTGYPDFAAGGENQFFQLVEPIICRAVVPLRLTGTPEFRTEIRARLKLRNREDEQMKVVHVGAVMPGAYDPRDIRAFVD
ncbi:hypothetical protein CsatA_004138 [Cannabis sativa]